MSLGRSRFSHIKTVRMLPSALDTSIRSVPKTPNAQRERALSHSREKYESVKRCGKQAVYQHRSSKACWSPSRWPDLLGSPGWCPPQPEIKRGQQRCEFANFIFHAVLNQIRLCVFTHIKHFLLKIFINIRPLLPVFLSDFSRPRFKFHSFTIYSK